MKSGEFLFARECHLSDIASRAGFTAEAFAKIVRNDEVKSRPSFNRSAGCPILQVNPIEHFDQLENANFDSGFFQQFASDTFLQTLADLQCATRN